MSEYVGAFMLDGSDPKQAEQAPDEVWIDWAYWPSGKTVMEDIFSGDEPDERADVERMKRKPVRYIRAAMEEDND